MKKLLVVLVLAVFVAGGAFAQINLSAGIGGNLGVYSVADSHPDYDFDNPDPTIGGGFFAFFDATYAMVRVGMYINSEEHKDPDFTTTATTLALGLYGKFPIDLGAFTLFPMIGFDYYVFLSADSDGEKFERGDLEKDTELDLFILKFGIGADFNITDSIYIRPTLLWGIDLTENDSTKAMKDLDFNLFRHMLDIGISVGFRF